MTPRGNGINPKKKGEKEREKRKGEKRNKVIPLQSWYWSLSCDHRLHCGNVRPRTIIIALVGRYTGTYSSSVKPLQIRRALSRYAFVGRYAAMDSSDVTALRFRWALIHSVKTHSLRRYAVYPFVGLYSAPLHIKSVIFPIHNYSLVVTYVVEYPSDVSLHHCVFLGRYPVTYSSAVTSLHTRRTLQRDIPRDVRYTVTYSFKGVKLLHIIHR